MPHKKVDNALCPINVRSYKFNHFKIDQINIGWDYFSNIFYGPKMAKFGFFNLRTTLSSKVQQITKKYMSEE